MSPTSDPTTVPAPAPSTRLSRPPAADDHEALRDLLWLHGERLERVARIRSGRSRAPLPLGRLLGAVERRLREVAAEGDPAEVLERLARLLEDEMGRLERGEAARAEAAGPRPRPVPARVPSDTDLQLWPRPDRGLLAERSLRRMVDGALAELPDLERELVVRIDYCGASFTAASRELGLSLDEAARRHREVWDGLRRRLGEELGLVLGEGRP